MEQFVVENKDELVRKCQALYEEYQESIKEHDFLMNEKKRLLLEKKSIEKQKMRLMELFQQANNTK